MTKTAPATCLGERQIAGACCRPGRVKVPGDAEGSALADVDLKRPFVGARLRSHDPVGDRVARTHRPT